MSPTPSTIILYVDDPARSAAFYGDLLGRTPLEASPGFVMFALAGEVTLGLWARRAAAPETLGGIAPAGGEIAFTAADTDAVHRDWRARGIAILQPPADLDFGRSFLAQDPDGHRLRVFTPGGGA